MNIFAYLIVYEYLYSMNKKDLEQYFIIQIAQKDELNKVLQSQIDTLNNNIEELTTKFDISLKAQATQFESLIKQLTDSINLLTKQKFGIKSERTPRVKVRDNINVSVSAPKVNGSKPVKRSFDGLEERIIPIYPDGDIDTMTKLRYEDTIKFKFVSAKVIKTIYRRWTCMNEGKVLTAEYPDFLMQRCNADASLLAFILTNKYQYHLPVERQLTYFKNIGIDIPKSTLHSWVFRSISFLSPIIDALKKEVLNQRYLNIDETTIPVLKSGLNHTKKGYLWGVLAPDSNLLFFDYVEGSRSRDVIVNLLGNYNGVIQSDGFSAYKVFESKEYRGKIVRLSCLAHIRRAIIEACDSDPRAKPHLDLIAKIYSVEYEIFGSAPNVKKPTEKTVVDMRIKHTAPILKELYRSLRIQLKDITILPKSKYRKAIVYALNEFPGLVRMLRYGYVRVDNNAAERMMKAPVLGRKNYLFTGEDNGGANRTADIYSLVESCKLCNINPNQYLEDVMRRLQETKSSNIRELLPNLWVPKNISDTENME